MTDEEKLFTDMVVREEEAFYSPAGDPDLGADPCVYLRADREEGALCRAGR